MNRTQKTYKNTVWGLVCKVLNMVLMFVSRTIFIKVLGQYYLGINGLYTEILNMLSFAELGFGTALTFAMYKPVAENDDVKTVQLLDLYRKIYRVIAIIVALIGIGLTPFLQYIVKGADDLSLFDLRLYFLIFLSNTVINYFVSYKYSYVSAIIENYVTTNIDFVVNCVIGVAQIIVILIFKNFLAYLLINTSLLIVSRGIISLYLNKRYPILADKPTIKLDEISRKEIFSNVKGLALGQFSSVAIHSTDNILISALSGLGVVGVGLISNYNLIINSVLSFALIIFNTMTSAFGNIVAEVNTDRYRQVFYELNLFNAWVYGFCAVAFFILIPPFITLVWGKEYIIETASFAIIVVNSYLQGQSTIYNNARIAKGEFNRDKWISFLQAIINLVISIVGAIKLGLLGIYIGTIISRVFFVVMRPVVIHKYLFEESCVKYFRKFTLYFVVAIISGVATYFVSKIILKNITILTFMLSVIVVAILPNLLFLIFYFRTEEFKKLLDRFKMIFLRSKKRG